MELECGRIDVNTWGEGDKLRVDCSNKEHDRGRLER